MDDQCAWDVKNVNNLMSFAFIIPSNSKLSTLLSLRFFSTPEVFSKESEGMENFSYSPY